MMRTWTRGHVLIESFKRGFPALANKDSTTAIAGIGFLMGVVTASEHASPDAIFRNIIGFITSIAMSSISFLGLINFVTSTRLGHAIFQIARLCNNQIATKTLTCPCCYLLTSTHHIACKCLDGEAAKNFPGQIFCTCLACSLFQTATRLRMAIFEIVRLTHYYCAAYALTLPTRCAFAIAGECQDREIIKGLTGKILRRNTASSNVFLHVAYSLIVCEVWCPLLSLATEGIFVHKSIH